MHKQRYNLKKQLAKSVARAQCFAMQNELNKAAKQAEELVASLRTALASDECGALQSECIVDLICQQTALAVKIKRLAEIINS